MRTLVPFYADDLEALRHWIVFLDRRFPDRRHALTSTAMGQLLPQIRIWWPDDLDQTATSCVLAVTLAKVRDSTRRRCFGLLPLYEFGAIFETADGVCLYTADRNLETLWRTLWTMHEPTRIDGLPLQTALRLDVDPAARSRPAVTQAASPGRINA